MIEWLRDLLPEVASAHGTGLDRVTVAVHLLAAVLFVVWGAIFVVSLWRFRRRRREEGKSSEGDVAGRPAGRFTGRWPGVAEGLVVAAEAAILLGLSIPLFSARLGEEPVATDAGEPVEVRVVAQQYAWNFHYPGPDGVFGPTDPSRVDEESNPVGLDREDPASSDDVVLVNQLHLPVDRVAVLRLSSKDVIHAFSVVEMRVKRDAVPGMVNVLTFEPTVTTGEMRRRLGDDFVYEIGCAQLCGLGHARMRGFLTVHDPEGFAAWMEGEQEKLEREVDPFWS